MSADTREDTLSGLGKALIAVYAVLALAATFRSLYQIITKFDEAPLAYSLSAVAGVVYLVATVALIGRSPSAKLVARIAITFELVGVLAVGTLSLVAPELFAHSSVWSVFGRDYLFIPLILPILGLVWLSRDARQGKQKATA